MAIKKLVAGGDLDYLREESLRAVLFCMLAVLYIWCLILFQPINLQPIDLVGDVAWGPGLLGIGLAVAFVIRKHSLALAAAAAIVGLTLAMLSTMWTTEAKVAPYMLAVVVSLAGLLFSMRIVVVTTVLCSIAAVAVSSLRWGYSPVSAEALSPVLVIGVVGILSFLAVRNLYMALHWALDRTMAAQRNEEEARIHRGELARTLKALTEAYQRLEYVNYDLARAREAAEDARLNKQRFVASVSHEMRTPLNVLTALSEMMYLSPERYGDAPLPPGLRRDAREIYRSSKHLLRLIDDVLDMAQIEAGQMRIDFKPIDLRDIVTETLDMIRPLVRGKGTALRAELPADLPPVLIDRDRIQQVLLNLLNNAQRFTEHGSITVRAKVEADEIEISVVDTGVGIPPSEHEAMFKEFYQVEGFVAQGQGGHGLGLAICKRFIEMHGGRIWVESDGIPGHGSQFHFTLPTAEAERFEISTLRESRIPLKLPRGRGRTLLLLDPDLAVQSLLEQELEAYHIVPIDDVLEVPRLIEELHAQAVLVNSAHKERRGKHLLALRRQLAHSPVPIILCPLAGGRQLEKTLGVMDYLVKPITRETLMDLLDRMDADVHRVLIIDDDPQMVHILARMLETAKREYRVTSAHNGEEGLRKMRAQRPDLVLLDLAMPEMDGYAMMAQMRENADLYDIPVVIVTAQRLTPEEERQMSGQTLTVHTGVGFTNKEILTYLSGILNASSALPTSS
ncbi:MAG: response regulator [Anaerolineae bacterium]|nr:response regulator [Anaerolineae bacterium]